VEPPLEPLLLHAPLRSAGKSAHTASEIRVRVDIAKILQGQSIAFYAGPRQGPTGETPQDKSLLAEVRWG
jgi:hypothetical protein